MRTYQDTLRNKGDSAVHRSVGDIHVVRCKASLRILCTLVTELEKRPGWMDTITRAKKKKKRILTVNSVCAVSIAQ